MAKKLTQVQIKMICEKLKREFEPREHMPKGALTEREMDRKNDKFLIKLVKASDLPPALKRFLTEVDNWGDSRLHNLLDDSCAEKVLKAIGAPHPCPAEEEVDIWDLREKHNKMLEDLKFSLTMADVENYEGVMNKFRDEVKKAFK